MSITNLWHSFSKNCQIFVLDFWTSLHLHPFVSTSLLKSGNMILIKDRHVKIKLSNEWILYLGKYDTYKGSTLFYPSFYSFFILLGKYDTYKGSTRYVRLYCAIYIGGKYDTYKGSTRYVRLYCAIYIGGKYDTYKGSTLATYFRFFHLFSWGNMILIKDRHLWNRLTISHLWSWGNMILIKDRHIQVHHLRTLDTSRGKYDTY